MAPPRRLACRYTPPTTAPTPTACPSSAAGGGGVAAARAASRAALAAPSPGSAAAPPSPPQAQSAPPPVGTRPHQTAGRCPRPALPRSHTAAPPMLARTPQWREPAAHRGPPRLQHRWPCTVHAQGQECACVRCAFLAQDPPCPLHDLHAPCPLVLPIALVGIRAKPAPPAAPHAAPTPEPSPHAQ